MIRLRYRHQLTIEECKTLLRDGHEITCAGGFRWFPNHTIYKFGNTYIGRVAMDHLRDHGFIEFGELSPHCATWIPSEKAKQQ